jgi:phosphoribosyl-ATP pyrophosphohydrolase/phosphoribosyl-AMP cyclohydrolase
MTDRQTEFLATLEMTIRQRLQDGDASSYTAQLAAAGDKRMAQKVGEEAVELALAAVAGDRDEQLNEAADLVYHLLVLLNASGLSLADVSALLERRHAGRSSA